MTKEERESIINEAVERTLLMIPEVIGNLIMNHAAKIRAGKLFYDKYPEFKSFSDIVASTIEEVEDKDFTKDMNEILELAVPEIKRRIEAVKNLDFKSVKKPDVNIDYGEL
jgi:hypothetical protein